ncbi:MAG: DUF1501 domain-containing protein [Pseudomonadota bacterium]|nr:DUF1501 domain-containing protein [Pseudomonadota bacterium]
MRAPLHFPLRTPLVGRRAFLGGAAATAAALAMPGRARAESVAPADRRFLFVYTMGGWDVTRVFAPLFGSPSVSMEPDAAVSTVGNVPYVDHPARPSVRAFFETWYDRVAVVNGIHISSISHSSAARMITTGTPDASVADWPSRLAAARAEAHVVPYLVVGGPNFSGRHGVHVGHAGAAGQLQGIADGSILANNDIPVLAPIAADSDRVDAWLQESARRAGATYPGAASKGLHTTFGIALDKAMQLKGMVDDVDLDRGTTFADQVTLAARVLRLGIARCVAVAHPKPEVNVLWDTHSQNDSGQSELFEDFFAEMNALMEVLETTPGAQAATLADETIVVVLSEMGRTPYVNGTGGKDHWPYTSALVLGPGVRGNQVIGGYDAGQYGYDIDPVTGAAVASGAGGSAIGPNVLGATLMVLGDVDPLAEDLVDEPIAALLE